MGSVGNPNPWPPYDTTSCSQGICTIYCPQYCYFFFPPPPLDRDHNDDDSGTPFSPLVIAVIILLSTALVFATYYTLFTKYCRRRNHMNNTNIIRLEEIHDRTGFDQWQAASHGLDDAVIKAITVCRYEKGAALIEGNECAVCLCEFQENESLRLLPKCSHAFHLPCIDTWLRSHSNCPLCRASVVIMAHPLSPPVLLSLPVGMDASESQPSDEVILTVEDDVDQGHGSAVTADQEGFNGLRRSVSLGRLSCKRQGFISDDVLKFEGINQNSLSAGKGKDQIGSSKGFEIKRCFSTGRLMFADDKVKNFLFLG